ncbi:MAG: hypothetical protein N2517_02100 [Ignavibacteria bacterium]|nr:hypothetical protein [Ignavibacteria bacterium]
MVSKLVSYFIITLTSLLAFLNAKEKYNIFKVEGIEICYNFPINQISKDFFDTYNKFSKSGAYEFNFKNFPSIKVDFKLPWNFNITLGFERMYLGFFSSFGRVDNFSYQSIFRSYSENFEFVFFPVAFSFHFAPYPADFYSVFHFQLGASFDKVKWVETVDSEFDSDPLQGTKTVNIRQVSPFLGVGFKVVYPFDIITADQVLDYFFFEAKVNLAYRRMKLFTSITDREKIDGFVMVLPFSITFVVGVRFDTRSLLVI